MAIITTILMSVIVHWRWVFLPRLFGGGDFSFFFKFPQIWQYYASLPQTWDSMWGNGFGTYNIIMSLYPIYVLFGLLAKLGVDLILSLKLLIFFPVVILGPLGAYLLFKKVSSSVYGGFIGSSVYLYNSYLLLLQHTGGLLVAISYALVPFLVWLVLLSLEKKSFKISIIAGLSAFVISTYEFRIFYLCSILLVILLIWQLISRRFAGFFTTISLGLLPILITTTLSLYWIIPLLAAQKVTDNIALGTGLFLSDMTLARSLTLSHPYWGHGKAITPSTTQTIPEVLYLLPIISIFALFKIKKYPIVGFFVALTFLGIMLTKQSAPPFPNLYTWLFNNFPGFSAFRESSKFYLFSGLGYAGLMAVSSTFFRQSRHYWVRLIPLVFVIYAFMLDTQGFVTGRLNGMFTDKSRPEVYQRIADYLSADTTYGRVLWFPSYSIWSYASPKHPRISSYLLYLDNFERLMFASSNFVPVVSPSVHTTHNYKIFNIFHQPYSQHILTYLGIKYVIIPPVDQHREDDLFDPTYGLFSDREATIKYIDSLSYLKKDNSFIGADIYRVASSSGELFISEEPLTLENIHQLTPAPYSISTPNRYHIKMSSYDRPLYLQFSQSRDAGWILQDQITGEIFPHASQSEQFGFNAFMVPPGHNQLVLYYKNQAFVHRGLFASGISLGLIAIIFALLSLKKHA